MIYIESTQNIGAMSTRSPPPRVTKKRSPKTSRAAQRAGTREQIRVAALELFSTLGFEETTTQAIAERAGVASGTVFLHASDKADLLFLVMHDRLETTVNARFDTLPADAPLLDRLIHVFSGLFRMYASFPKMGAAFVRLLPGAAGPNAQRAHELTYAFIGRIAGLIAEGQQRGEVARDLDLARCARNVFSLYFAALIGWLSGLVPIEALDDELRASLTLQFRGFRP